MPTLTIGGKTARSKYESVAVTYGWSNDVLHVNDKPIPAASVDFILAYGLKQYLADGVAGAESQEDFDSGVAERVRKVLEADFARTKGERVETNDPDKLARKLALSAWTAAMKTAGHKDKLQAMDSDAKAAAWAKSVFGPDGTKFQSFVDEATRQIAARAELAAETGDLGI